MNLKDFINIDQIKKRIKEITALYREGAPKVEISEEAKKISALLRSSGLGVTARRKLGEIFSIITEERIITDMMCPMGIYPFGCMIVLTDNPNSHNYTLNEPILIDARHTGSKVAALRINGTIGNSLPKKEYVRVATDEEIDYFFEHFDYYCGRNYLITFLTTLG